MNEEAKKIEAGRDLRDVIEPEAADLWVRSKSYSWSDAAAFSQAVSLRRIADAVGAICDDIRREKVR